MRQNVDEILLIIGAVLITIGVFFMSIPAGLITSGVWFVILWALAAAGRAKK